LKLSGLRPEVQEGIKEVVCLNAMRLENYHLVSRACEGLSSADISAGFLTLNLILARSLSGEAPAVEKARIEFHAIVDRMKSGAKNDFTGLFCRLGNAGASLDRDAALWIATHRGSQTESGCATLSVKLNDVSRTAALLQGWWQTGYGQDIYKEIHSVASAAVERHLDSRLWLQLERAPTVLRAEIAVEMAHASQGRLYLNEARDAVALVQDFDTWSRLMGRLGAAWAKTRPAREAMAMTAQCRPSDRIETLTSVLEKVASARSGARGQ